jgi:carboxypeptidase Taq
VIPAGPSVAAQRALSQDAMHLLGFDFDAGRLDERPPVLRRRARGRAHDHALPRGRLPPALMGIHETGHGRYEQNLPRECWASRSRGALHGHPREPEPVLRDAAGQPPGFAACWRRCWPGFGAQPAFEPDNLHKLMTRVQPGGSAWTPTR